MVLHPIKIMKMKIILQTRKNPQFYQHQQLLDIKQAILNLHNLLQGPVAVFKKQARSFGLNLQQQTHLQHVQMLLILLGSLMQNHLQDFLLIAKVMF